MDKEKALRILNAISNSYVYTLLTLQGAPSIPLSDMKEAYVTFGMDEHTQTIHLSALYKMYNEDQLLDLFSHAERSLARNLHRESFEAVKKYCESTNQLSVMRGASWYHFSRVVRNCLSHDWTLKFLPHEMKHLPATYRTATIDASLQGKPPPRTINGQLIFALHKDMRQFVVERLQ